MHACSWGSGTVVVDVLPGSLEDNWLELKVGMQKLYNIQKGLMSCVKRFLDNGFYTIFLFILVREFLKKSHAMVAININKLDFIFLIQ